jgi:CheY-like chemotaxis protein
MTLLIPPPGPVAPSDTIEAEPWRPRSDADLLAAQLRALDEWHRRALLPAEGFVGQSRESRLDEARRRDVAEREREALHAWAEAALLEEHPLGRGGVPRAVVAHRSEWLGEKICSGLREAGVEIAAMTADGAVASAAVVMEQPDLVFVEDLLPSLNGVELIRRTRIYAPTAVIGAHALGQAGMPPLLDAGARATFSRRIPPTDIAAELVACLHGRRDRLTMV